MTRRVAVEVGTAAVRVARAGPDGWARVTVAATGGRPPDGDGLADLLAGLVPTGVDEVVLLHPVDVPRHRLEAWVAAVQESAARVRTLPAAVAVAAATGGDGPVVVVDAGAAATRVTAVVAGRVAAHRVAPGGDLCDDAVIALLGGLHPELRGAPHLRTGARRVRQEVALQPWTTCRVAGGAAVPVTAVAVRHALRGPFGRIADAVADVVRDVGRTTGGAAVPVLVAGGLARTPALVELLDRVAPAIRVLPEPDSAALTHALLPAPRSAARDAVRRGPAGERPAAPPARDGRLGPVPALPGRTRRRIGTAAALVVVLGALYALGGLLPGRVPAASAAGTVVQYGYRIALPEGWAHTGGLPERRRTLLTPLAAPAGSDVIAVELSPLGYDTGAEPQRAADELRAEFDAAAGAGGDLAGYGSVRYGGRAVTTYVERDEATEVRWYVVLDRDAQLSVGCRHTAAGAPVVLAACEVVVASIGLV